jgi:hypothetical protein
MTQRLTRKSVIRELTRKAAQAGAAKLTPEERSARARKAAKARWAKHKASAA